MKNAEMVKRFVTYLNSLINKYRGAYENLTIKQDSIFDTVWVQSSDC